MTTNDSKDQGREAPWFHELKTDPEVFAAVLDGDKTHEIRFNDRDFKVGDTLLLRETRYAGQEMRGPEPRPLEYTGREITRVVSHVLEGYGLKPGWVILSFAALATSASALARDEASVTESVAVIQTLMLDWINSKPGPEAKSIWVRIEEKLVALATAKAATTAGAQDELAVTAVNGDTSWAPVINRNFLGQIVRDAWIKWAKQQPAPKASWLMPYADLSEPDKEADRQIGEAVLQWVLSIKSATWEVSLSTEQARAASSATAHLTSDSQAARDVLAERQRQMSVEGWTPEHDDEHSAGQLAGAASCYAAHVNGRQWVFFDGRHDDYRSEPAPDYWPWDESWWKPTTPRRDLVKAGALILAEIERIDRAQSTNGEQS